MIIAVKRRGSRGRTLTVALPAAPSIVVVMLAVFAPAHGPSTRGESPSAAEVSLGIGGTHRTGSWTPLVVRLPAAAAGDSVRAWVEDADGQLVGSPPAPLRAAGPGNSTAVTCVRPGRPTVRVMVERISRAGEGSGPGVISDAVAAIASPAGTTAASTTPLLLVHGNVPAAAAAARLVAGEETTITVVAFAAPPATVSLTPRDFDAFDAAIICGQAVADLDTDTRAAIDGLIRRGGRLVLAAGVSAVGLAAAGGPVADWLPGAGPRLVPLRRVGALEAFARSGGLTPRLPPTGISAPRFEAAGSITGVVNVFEGASAADTPLVIRRAHGLGMITWIGLDIDQPWCADWPGCDRLVAALLGGRSDAEQPATPTDTRQQTPDLAGQLRMAMDTLAASSGQPASLPVPFEVIAGLGLLYCLLLYPVDWWLVRRSGRPSISWITLPLVAGGFAALAWGMGAVWGRDAPARLRLAEVIDFDAAGGLVRGSAWAAVRSPANALVDLAVAADDRWATGRCDAAVSWFADAGTGFGGVDAAATNPPLAAADYAYGPSLAALVKAPVSAASSRLFEASWVGQAREPVAETTLTRDGRGLLAGTITSRLPMPLERCWLVHGGWLYDVGRMEPGDTYDTEAGRGPRSLAAALTRRTAVKDRDRAERWDAATTDVGRILEVAGLHAAAGGSGYTGLEPGRLGRLDLSPLVAVDRGLLVGTAAAGTRLTAWRVRLSGEGTTAELPAESAAPSLVRLVVRVRPAAVAEPGPAAATKPEPTR